MKVPNTSGSSRSQNGQVGQKVDSVVCDVDLSETFLLKLFDGADMAQSLPTSATSRETIIMAQKSDPEIQKLFAQAVTPEEAEEVPSCLFVQDGLVVVP